MTATGLNPVLLGEVEFSVDGTPVDFSKTWSYKGVALSGVPNLFVNFGYVNASWTLRADLVSIYVCKVLNHMQNTGLRQCTPRLRPSDRSMRARRWIEGFNPGYMERAMHLFPSQSEQEPWINPQNYKKDKHMFLKEPLEDGVFEFSNPGQASTK